VGNDSLETPPVLSLSDQQQRLALLQSPSIRNQVASSNGSTNIGGIEKTSISAAILASSGANWQQPIIMTQTSSAASDFETPVTPQFDGSLSGLSDLAGGTSYVR